jgi:hypothetical protein
MADVVIDVTVGSPTFAKSNRPQVVLRSLEQLALMMRDSIVIQHDIQRMVLRPIDLLRWRHCLRHARDRSFEFRTHLRDCAVDCHPHFGVFGARSDDARWAKMHGDLGYRSVRIGSAAPARIEAHRDRFDTTPEPADFRQ